MIKTFTWFSSCTSISTIEFILLLTLLLLFFYTPIILNNHSKKYCTHVRISNSAPNSLESNWIINNSLSKPYYYFTILQERENITSCFSKKKKNITSLALFYAFFVLFFWNHIYIYILATSITLFQVWTTKDTWPTTLKLSKNFVNVLKTLQPCLLVVLAITLVPTIWHRRFLQNTRRSLRVSFFQHILTWNWWNIAFWLDGFIYFTE